MLGIKDFSKLIESEVGIGERRLGLSKYTDSDESGVGILDWSFEFSDFDWKTGDELVVDWIVKPDVWIFCSSDLLLPNSDAGLLLVSWWLREFQWSRSGK